MKRWIAVSGLALAAGGLALAASTAFGADPSGGADEVGQFYITPELGGTFVNGGDRHADDALYYGGAVGENFSEDWSGELNAVTGKHSGTDGRPDLRITAISADILRVFDRDSFWAPYLLGGLGVIIDNPVAGSSHDNLLAEVGGGFLIHTWHSADGSMTFDLRPQLKVRFDDLSYGHPVDVLLGIGFQFGFGARVVQPAPAAAPPPPPAAPPPPPPPPPPPRPARHVNPKCPNAPPGVALDAEGCPLVGSITLRGVHFATDSARLTPESSAILDPIAAELKAHPGLKIEVQGYTDGRASQAYNLRLSQARAASVRDYLIAHGVGADELSAKGFGKLHPVATNATKAGRALNRRVVLEVLENPGNVTVKQEGAGR
jgi:OmpA-OmpF porin, OOP family